MVTNSTTTISYFLEFFRVFFGTEAFSRTFQALWNRKAIKMFTTFAGVHRSRKYYFTAYDAHAGTLNDSNVHLLQQLWHHSPTFNVSDSYLQEWKNVTFNNINSDGSVCQCFVSLLVSRFHMVSCGRLSWLSHMLWVPVKYLHYILSYHIPRSAMQSGLFVKIMSLWYDTHRNHPYLNTICIS